MDMTKKDPRWRHLRRYSKIKYYTDDTWFAILDLVVEGKSLRSIAQYEYVDKDGVIYHAFPALVDMFKFFNDQEKNAEWSVRYKTAIEIQTQHFEEKNMQLHEHVLRCVSEALQHIRDEGNPLGIHKAITAVKQYDTYILNRRKQHNFEGLSKRSEPIPAIVEEYLPFIDE